MPQKVFVTGMGIISSIGNNCSQNFKSIVEITPGISDIEILETVYRKKFKAGEIKYSNKQLAEMASGNSDNLTRTALLGMIAAAEAMAHAQIKNFSDDKTGFISSTTVAGMCRTELLYGDFLQSKINGSFIETNDCGDSTECIADFLGIKNNITTISTACSSSANAIIHGSRLIKSGKLNRVVAGGTDVLSKFTLNGFHSLQILDEDWCKPFDENRKGLNLGEGAAYLVLESEDQVLKEGKKILCEIKGYGNANDAYHQTASSPEGTGAFLAMQEAIQTSGINPGEINYINAHGTGTMNNDLTEGIALKKIFGKNIPAFSSTKSFTGHTLAAAGAVEAVFSILALTNGLVIPNLNFSDPISALDIIPEKKMVHHADLKYVLSNSFGFGGNCSSLIFGKV
ncbi:MAG TPA: beta-ketoacyl-[acyl-carrier-protein] synthase family protein [Bacteroidia bacterium]|nr:beta-ketoacyl-[acyl-carrier-protein] synthase family protein [Bacteroidia bacterium]